MRWQHRDLEIKSDMKPVDFRLKAGQPIKIRVVDSAGKPLAGARIEQSVISFGPPNIPPVGLVSTTDEQGKWTSASEPEGVVSLQISKQGYATECHTFASGGKRRQVTLRPPLRFTGRVIDAKTKKPLKKVHLSVGQHL